MKKMTLAFAFASAAMTAQAQKNSLYIGGNVGFNSTSGSVKDAGGQVTDGAQVTNWSFSPEVGTFLTNHVQLGAGITLAGKKDDARTDVKNVTRSTQTGITIYSRYFSGKEISVRS